jgi:glutamine amidotransferase
MCRLFALVAPAEASATRMLEAFGALSERNPDGWGIAQLTKDGEVVVTKSGQQASIDPKFAAAARVESRAHLAHLRAATFAKSSEVNSHPFLAGNTALAHNGAFFDLPGVEAAISPERLAGIRGYTDSERYLALVETKVDTRTRELEAAGQHVDAAKVRDEALVDAARQIGATVPTWSMNALLLNADGVRALRVPDTNGLWMLRSSLEDARRGARALVRDGEPAQTVFSSQPLDGDPGWTELRNGELVHARLDGTIHRQLVDAAPERQITRQQVDELGAVAAKALGAEGGQTAGSTAY